MSDNVSTDSPLQQEDSNPLDALRVELDHRERQIAALKYVSEALFDHLTMDEVLEEVLRVAIEVLKADVGSLQLYDPATDCLVFRHCHDPYAKEKLVGFSTPASQGISGKVFRSGVPDVTQHIEESKEFNPDVDEMTGYRTRSMLTAALRRFGGDRIGVIQILNSSRSFDERDLDMLEVLCGQAATSVETARLLEQARKIEVLNLVGDISHEVKNLLTPIKSGAWTLETVMKQLTSKIEAICETCPPDECWSKDIQQVLDKSRSDYSDLFGYAVNAAEKLEARTLEIADAVKGEVAPMVVVEANLNETVCDVAAALRLVAKSADLSLLLELDADMPFTQFDGRQMFSAIYNVAINAIPETPPGGVITLRTLAPVGDAEEVTIEVEDTGRGMTEEVRARAFSDSPISTKEGGSGLGTRIVATIVRRHGGTLSVQTEEGHGTTVALHLPLRLPTSATPVIQ